MQSPSNMTLSASSSASIFVVTVSVFPIGSDSPQQRQKLPFFLFREAREPSNELAIGVIDNLFDEASCRLESAVWGRQVIFIGFLKGNKLKYNKLRGKMDYYRRRVIRMYSRSLYMDRDDIIAKIHFCLNEGGAYDWDYVMQHDFPIVGILYQIYEMALYDDEIIINDSLSNLLDRYKKLHSEFTYSEDDLMDLGWVETCYGHRHIIGHMHHSDSEEFLRLYKSHEYADIIRFVLWADSQKDGMEFVLAYDKVARLLDGWRNVCPDVPEMSWFEEQKYLAVTDEIGVVLTGAGYNASIAEAMGKLWDRICEQDDFERLAGRWEQLAFHVNLSAEVCLYVKNEDRFDHRSRLLSTVIIPAVKRECENMSRELECRKALNAHRFASDHRIEFTIETMEECLYGVHRALDRRGRFVYEDMFLWRYKRRWGDNFYLGSALRYLWSVPEDMNKEFFDTISAYESVGRLDKDAFSLPAENVLEFLLHEETFYFGVMSLFKNVPKFKRQMAEYQGYVEDIIRRVLEFYTEREKYPKSEDLLDILLYLMDCNKKMRMSNTNENPYFAIYKSLMDLFLLSDCSNGIISESCKYFECLMALNLSDVDFDRCFSLLSNFAEKIIDSFEGDTGQIVRAYDLLIDCIFLAIKRMLAEEGRWSHFVDPDCFTERLCKDVYERCMEDLTDRQKREAVGFSFSTEEKSDLCYRFRIASRFITRVCRAGNGVDDTAYLLNSILEKALVEDQILDYCHIVTFAMEETLGEALRYLETKPHISNGLFKRIKGQGIPELVLFRVLLASEEQDRSFGEEIENKINEEDAAEKIIPRIREERFVDCVIENGPECLYPIVERELKEKLYLYEKRGMAKNNQYVVLADSQWKRLLYIQNRTEELLESRDPFFTAVIKTDSIKSYPDYVDAVTMWRRILDRSAGRKYVFAVCYNFVFSVRQILDVIDAIEDEKTAQQKETIRKDFHWICELSMRNAVTGWSKKNQAMFLDLVFSVSHRIGENTYTLLSGMQTKMLKLASEDIYALVINAEKEQMEEKDEADESEQNESLVIYRESGSSREAEIVSSMQSFSALELEVKSRLMAVCKGYYVDGRDWIGAFLLRTVLKGCRTLVDTIPYVLSTGSRENASDPPEDHISIVFRECYNMAYAEFFNIRISDQEKRSTTGKVISREGVMSPAEVDMVCSYDGHTHELFEAFILNGNSTKCIFRDHMVKALGNDVYFHSPRFMLVYCFEDAVTQKKKWGSYIDYLDKEFASDFAGVAVCESRIGNIEDSMCYVSGFTGAIKQFKIIRQIISIEDNEIELFHILVDMSYSFSRNVRKA